MEYNPPSKIKNNGICRRNPLFLTADLYFEGEEPVPSRRDLIYRDGVGRTRENNYVSLRGVVALNSRKFSTGYQTHLRIGYFFCYYRVPKNSATTVWLYNVVNKKKIKSLGAIRD